LKAREIPKKEIKTYVHGEVTYRGIIRDSCHGNPTGTIALVMRWILGDEAANDLWAIRLAGSFAREYSENNSPQSCVP